MRLPLNVQAMMAFFYNQINEPFTLHDMYGYYSKLYSRDDEDLEQFLDFMENYENA